jgi:hypothetical protein
VVAILEFPQSGERFIGKDAFMSWRRAYPGRVEYRLRRFLNEGDLWIVEVLIRYDGGLWTFGVGIYRFRGDKIAHETNFWTEPFEAAAWRAEFATPFDPLASIAPADWRGETDFGLDAEDSAA